MIVIGNQGTTIQHRGQFADVRPFSDEVKTLVQVPIVDSVIAYDHPYSEETILLIAKNALSIPSMNHNLIPPFIMRCVECKLIYFG